MYSIVMAPPAGPTPSSHRGCLPAVDDGSATEA
jgi:hypothetical protein